jgi:ABC-type uncharacterized transport system substrate-binding protein
MRQQAYCRSRAFRHGRATKADIRPRTLIYSFNEPGSSSGARELFARFDTGNRRNRSLAAGLSSSSPLLRSATIQNPFPRGPEFVFATGTDPVKDGLVTNLNRPGANVTGVSFFAAAVGAKRLDQLRQLVPSAMTIGVLDTPDNTEDRKDVEVAARAIGQQLIVLSAANASEIQAAFATFAQRGVGALIVTSSAFTFSHRGRMN